MAFDPAYIPFLIHWAPQGPWTLTAIWPDGGGVESAAFLPGQEAAMTSWVQSRNARANLYFTVNPLLPSFTDPLLGGKSGKGVKAKKTDIAALAWIHADMDPRPLSPDAGIDPQAWLRAEGIRARTRLYALPQRPTAIIASGGGVQAFWRLSEPIAIDGDLARAADAEGYNLGMALALESDHVQNCDRIMRLPGTMNWPDKKKIAKGREPWPASITEFLPGRSFPARDFPNVPAKATSIATGDIQQGPTVRLSGNRPRYKSVDDLPTAVSAKTRKLILHGMDPADPQKWGDRSKLVWKIVCQLVRDGLGDDQIAGIILDKEFGISAHVLAQPKPEPYAARQIQKARDEAAEDEEPKPNLTDMAQGWLERRGARLLRYDGKWSGYKGGAYKEIEDEALRAELWRRHPEAAPAGISGILDAAIGLRHVAKDSISPPCWLDGRAGLDPKTLLVLRNGILDLASGKLLAHTDQFFTRNALDFDYDPTAPTPERFMKLLDELWPGDAEKDCIATLQKMFGLFLTPDTSLQKIFALVGPPRCGKGTLGRVLDRLLGTTNICHPTLRSLGTNFGLMGMMGKQLALISDLRLDKNLDTAPIVETMLRISGEDRISIERKYLDPYDDKLNTRLLLLANDPPTLNDTSGALMARNIILQMRQSFVGNEDYQLDAKLALEMPGILNWAIAGRRALLAAGKIEQPASAAAMVREMGRGGSPLKGFIEDECVIDDDAWVDKDDLFWACKDWHEQQHKRFFYDKGTFSTALSSVCAGVQEGKHRDGGDRAPVYKGIKFNPDRSVRKTALHRFIDDCCDVNDGVSCSEDLLFRGWEQWAQADRRIYVGSVPRLGKRLEQSGFTRRWQKEGNCAVYDGLTLKAEIIEQLPDLKPPF